jgi:hypothetical protein
LGCNCDTENHIRTKFGHRRGIACLFQRLAKAFERVNWTKLIQIIKGTDIEWRERRLIRNLCMDQCVKLRVDQGKTRSLKKGR